MQWALRIIIAMASLTLPAGLGRAGEEGKHDEGRRHVEKPDVFQRIARVEPPRDGTGWSRTPIDRFVRAKLREQGLVPAEPADPRVLIRRVTFDLTGLPPTPDEIESFLRDQSTESWERLVERLLASPAYGEHWGRHWLDVVRYADTGGFEADLSYKSAWRYRDYVIRSLNADKPFDRFIQEQVAGDEMWPDDRDAIAATAMYCVGPALSESAMVSNQLEYEWLTDAVDVTGAAFLGLTLGCARCHDHKYDPITQSDYFALQAVFAASDRPFPEKVRDTRIKSLNGLLSEGAVPKELRDDPRCTVQTEAGAGFRMFHRAEPFVVHRLHRGEVNKPREESQPAIPEALRSEKATAAMNGATAKSRRRVLAEWLTSDENPLVARVLVNRIWGWHFGQGLVRTPNDFGVQGEPASHPELLDWLARDLIEQGWSLKHLHRRILLSQTYRMQSRPVAAAIESDPENRLLSHFPCRRLEGEAIRDAILSCAGSLNPAPFGPAVVPPLGSLELAGLFDAKGKWPVTKDAAEHTRRSVYLLVRRTFVYPLFAAFDPPEVMTSCARRQQTIVPTQALTLLNAPVVREQAAAFARRLVRERGSNPDALVERAWLLALGRPPSDKERSRAVEFLQGGSIAASATTAEKAEPEAGTGAVSLESALSDLCLALFNANEFIYVD